MLLGRRCVEHAPCCNTIGAAITVGGQSVQQVVAGLPIVQASAGVDCSTKSASGALVSAAN
eukprot:6806651-Alexandrium_andersonii.AAC.1